MKTQRIFTLIFLLLLVTLLPGYVFAQEVPLNQSQTVGCSGTSSYSLPTLLTLKSAKCLAVQNSPSQVEAVERILQASARVRLATSAYFPSVDFGFSWQRAASNDSAVTPKSADTYQTNLSVSWVLFNGFKRQYATAAALEDKLSSIEAEKNTQRLLIGSVGQAYYNALYYQEAITIAAANHSFQQQLLEEAEIRLKAGTSSVSDHLNFKIQLKTAQSELIKSKQNYQVALIGLINLLGISESVNLNEITLTPLSLETQPETVPDLKDLTATSLKQRPDLIQFDHSISQIDASLGELQADYYPTIALTGNLSANRLDNVAFESDDFTSSIGLTLSMNLFSGNRSSQKREETKSKRRETQAQLQKALLAIKGDLAKTLTEFQSIRELVEVQQQMLKLVQQNRDQILAEYKAGKASYTQLNEAQNELTRTLARLTQAQMSLLQAWEQLQTLTADNLNLED